ncbi:DUF6221 family protein [Streptomyces sp. UMAF16]|nr:DUF6221 family protein [Streptomyces sp. UMAF16]
MDELVRWFGEQLDEEERVARAADDTLGKVNLDWQYQPEDPMGGRVVSVRGADLIPDVTAGIGAHVAEYDPRRVLCEINAKRQILLARENASKTLSATEPGTAVHDLMTGAVNSYDHVIRLHAAAYDGRPGYREEWRP